MKRVYVKTIVVMLCAMIFATTPVCAAYGDDFGIMPCYNNIASAQLTIGFDTNNVVYCTLIFDPYSHGSGASGLMKLFDSTGSCIAIWSISDYERPIAVEHTYQGVYGETYTVTFEGYAYSNNQTAPDRVELSVTATCED